MADHVIDTNVLLVASAPDRDSSFRDTNVPPAERQTVFEWLAAFSGDSERSLVLDAQFSILREYRKKLTPQDFGLQTVTKKLARCRQVEIELDGDGAARLPAAIAAAIHDPADRKFVAVALNDAGRSTIVNATDSDWYAWEAALGEAGVQVEQLLDAWCRAHHERKAQR